MPQEESSAEVIAVSGDSVAITPITRRTPGDYVALAVATCGVGYLPIAPGTWGSLVGVGLYLLWQRVGGRFYFTFGNGDSIFIGYEALWTSLTLLLLIGVTMVGIWAATRVERLSGRKDPGIVVIDEVAGQLITLSITPHFHYREWPLVLVGFLLFRAFDIWKPYPIRKLEALESGLGIMADDVLAGMYAATVLSLGAAFYYWSIY